MRFKKKKSQSSWQKQTARCEKREEKLNENGNKEENAMRFIRENFSLSWLLWWKFSLLFSTFLFLSLLVCSFAAAAAVVVALCVD